MEAEAKQENLSSELEILEKQNEELNKREEIISEEVSDRVLEIETFDKKCQTCSKTSNLETCEECKKEKSDYKRFMGTSVFTGLLGAGITTIFSFDPFVIGGIGVVSTIMGGVFYKLIKKS